MLDILFRDANLVVVQKPSGILVHPSTLATDRVTCMSVLRDQLGQRVYPVHRLDRGASGALVFALSPADAARLNELFRSRDVTKRYLAIVRGWFPDAIELDYPLVEEDGGSGAAAEAITRFRLLRTTEIAAAVSRHPTSRYALVEAEPVTGRRHQIRRHLAHLRHPIIGDAVHGDGRHNRFFRESFGCTRLLLHAASLQFPHPDTGATVNIEVPLPEDFRRVADAAGLGFDLSRRDP